jgi:hypothetical protein
LTERVTALTRQIEEQGSLIRTTESQRNETSAELMTATAQVAKLTERENALTEKSPSKLNNLRKCRNS